MTACERTILWLISCTCYVPHCPLFNSHEPTMVARLSSDAVVTAPVRLCIYLTLIVLFGPKQTSSFTDLLSDSSSWPVEVLRDDDNNNNNNNNNNNSGET